MIKFSIDGRDCVINSEIIEAVCLFGSNARGDNDKLSDLDLFILIEDCDEESFVRDKRYFAESLGLPIDWISLYRKSTVKIMQSYGSYFLWHTKLEGKILFSRSGIFEELLSTLPPYTRVKQDLKDYQTICSDIRKSISEDDITLCYELSVLASLARNTCITLCYLSGKLEFGRITPIIIGREIIGESQFPFSVEEYQELYSFRIARVRGNIKPSIKPTVDLVENWVDRIEQLLGYCNIKENEKNE